MKKIKRVLRLTAMVLLIAVATIIPFPIGLFRKDLPTNKVEQIDPDDEE